MKRFVRVPDFINESDRSGYTFIQWISGRLSKGGTNALAGFFVPVNATSQNEMNTRTLLIDVRYICV